MGSINGEGKVVDDRTMIRLRFFCGWSKKYQFLPKLKGQREYGSECNHKKLLQLLSAAVQDSAIMHKITEKFPVLVWG